MISRFFIDRPIFAAVVSIVITLVGAIALYYLPIAQYPRISPPGVSVSISYPGASAKVVADTVAAPIEQQVNGVPGMLYMSSQMGNDGSYTLSVTFDIGVDLNTALVMVQNRVALAMKQLPTEVQNQGITIRKKTPDILMIVNFYSPDGRFDDIFLEQLRDDQLQGRVAPRAGRLGYFLSRPAGLQHSRVARSAENGGAEHHGGRCGQRHAGAESRCAGGASRTASRAAQSGFSIADRRAGPLDDAGGVRRHHHQGESHTISAAGGSAAGAGRRGQFGERANSRRDGNAVQRACSEFRARRWHSVPWAAPRRQQARPPTGQRPRRLAQARRRPARRPPAPERPPRKRVRPAARPASRPRAAPHAPGGGTTGGGAMTGGSVTSGGISAGSSPADVTNLFAPTALTDTSTTSPGLTLTPGHPSIGIVRLRDVARVEMGAANYNQSCLFDGQPSVGLGVYQLPGTNALDVADRVRAKMEELKTRFPDGLAYQIAYDTTPFIRESVNDVILTLLEATALVGVVVLVFLQSWRSVIIPLIAVPVAIIGTFAVMALLGYSLNNISLFGLVLAIGIVVDDAIVVVENVERWLEHGLAPARSGPQGDG